MTARPRLCGGVFKAVKRTREVRDHRVILRESPPRPHLGTPDEHGEHLYPFAQTLCATVAGGCSQAETLDELAQTLCATVAGGCGQAQEPEEHGEHLHAFAQTLCTTVAGGRGQAEALSVFGQTLCSNACAFFSILRALVAVRRMSVAHPHSHRAMLSRETPPSSPSSSQARRKGREPRASPSR
jgi:hypothetical protein